MPEIWSLWNRSLPALLVQGLLLILFLGALTTPALAHRMLIFAYAEGDTIHVESKFVPDTPVRQGKVLVLDEKTGKELLTGQTNDQGKFSFKIPPLAASEKMDLKIVTEAARGHRGEWLLKAESYVGGGKTAISPTTPPVPVAALCSITPGAKAATIDQQVLEAALNKALERQLAPIKEMLTELTMHRTSLTDILGGIGYILGFFGLWAYFQSKKRSNS